MKISVETNAHIIAAQFGALAADQIPFASAQALTSLAFDAQRSEKSELAKALTLRNRFSQTGIQVNRAEKADWPNQHAEVGVAANRSYLIDHITGGKRKGGSHGRAILGQESLRAKSGRVPGANRPGTLIKKAQRAKRQAELNRAFGGKGVRGKNLPFLLEAARWGGEVLAKRTGDDHAPLQILYAFKKGVSIKPQFDMVRVAEQSVQGGYYQAYTKALGRAVASAKRAR